MATAWRKKNEKGRRQVALANLEKARFFPKNDRKEEDWEAKRQLNIEILTKRING